MRWRLPLVFAAIGLTTLTDACRQAVFFHREEGAIHATEKEITIDVPSESDIVIVLDNSGSMKEKIERTARDIVNFTRELSASGNRFRIAVTTTDILNNDPTNAACTSTLNLPVDADPKNNGRCGRFLKPKGRTETFLDSQSFTTPEDLATRFGEYVRIDSTIYTLGSPVEQSIKASYMALDPKLTVAGGPNAGFFRDDALLLVMLITDESDCSFAPDSDGAAFTSMMPFGLACYSGASGLLPSNDWANLLLARHGGDKRKVAVGVISGAVHDGNGILHPGGCVIVDGKSSDQCDCFLDNPGDYCQFTRGGVKKNIATCTGSGCCTSIANSRLFDFAANFHNVRDTICQDSFADALVKLAQLADQQCFPLDKIPTGNDPANIQIEIKRKDETKFAVVPTTTKATPGDGWFYDTDGAPLVCLNGTFKRRVGDTLRVFVIDEQTGVVSPGQ